MADTKANKKMKKKILKELQNIWENTLKFFNKKWKLKFVDLRWSCLSFGSSVVFKVSTAYKTSMMFN